MVISSILYDGDGLESILKSLFFLSIQFFIVFLKSKQSGPTLTKIKVSRMKQPFKFVRADVRPALPTVSAGD